MAYGLCVQVLIMFMYNMFDFNDKILYDVREGLYSSNVHTCTCICQYVLMNEYIISKKRCLFIYE